MADLPIPKALGRVHVPDERDAAFPMAAAAGKTKDHALRERAKARSKNKRIKSFRWRVGPVLDQGAYPHCVAYAWKQYLQSDPVRHGTLLEEPFLYELCQKYDQWAGEDYDGTSVRAGAKILRNLGYIQSYHWARTIGEIQDWLKTTGPVVLGTYWYTDMFYPDDDGLVTATGQAAGGHAYICVGYNVRKKEFLCVNSWGRDWGRRGKFKIGAVDLQKLLNKHGEACVALESSV